ncbi:TetR/AcrR family transcriptional regulator [Nocardioides stalactiti]|uniref:TetR/AcrR family transcriptional regulator n=1 Tax=Nocardioides stalactiti TaxID=2755356 RepID=UPI0015FF7FAC|nr:TetR/AcrR family transcriptional regulator [Nocardioides stalactiti]
MGIQRPYRGVAADDRRQQRRAALLEAALDCLGGDDAEISVRRVCALARLTPRYFYESFESLDELQLALFTQIAEEVALEGGAALVTNPTADVYDGCRTAFEAGYAVLRSDPRKARAGLVASNTSGLMEARRKVVLTYAETMLGYLAEEFGEPVDLTSARVAVLYAVGGALELTHAALNGDIEVSDEALIDLAAQLLASSVQLMVAPGH